MQQKSDLIARYGIYAWVFFIPISTALTNVSAMVVVLCWLFDKSTQIKWRFMIWHPAMRAILIFSTIALLSISYTQATSSGLLEATADLARLLSIGVLLYYFCKMALHQQALVLFIAAMALTMLLGMLKLGFELPIGEKYLAGAVFKHHIITSFLMATSAFILANWMLDYPRFRKLTVILLLFMLYSVLFLNVGRTGYVALSVYTLVFFFFRFNLKKGLLGILAGSFVIMVAVGYSPHFLNRIQALKTDWQIYTSGGPLSSSSLGSRVEFAQNSLKLIAQKPILGWGLGSFATVYQTHYDDTTALLTTNPHNEFLKVGVELGMVGFIALIAIFVNFWHLASMLTLEQKVIFRGFLVAFMIGCSVNSWLTDFTELSLFCFMTACFLNSFPKAKVLLKMQPYAKLS